MSIQRKYFGTDGIRGTVGQAPITPDFVLKLGWAAGRVLSRKTKHGRILIGKDTRISGYMFESALISGLSAAGIEIQLLGPMPTPGVAYLTRTLRADAGIVISASHNPFHDNGIKFIASNGKKLPDEMELEIEQQLDEPLTTVASEKLGKASRIEDARGRYIEFCKSTVPAKLSLKGLKIVLDCANGAAYHVAPSVFRELDAEVLELSVDPDGVNINDYCGATHPEMLRKIVLAEKADLGIALDGDGDRVIMVDHCGEIVDGDELLFIMASYLQSKNRIQGGVVGTFMSNLGLEHALNHKGIAFARSKVGDRYVMDELSNRGWILGGETSGHIINLDITTTGDGVLSALQILTTMVGTNHSLHELKKGMQKLPQKLINVRIAGSLDINSHAGIQTALKHYNSALDKNGRILLRASGTEPLIRVMVEGYDKDQVNQIAEALANDVRNAVN